MLAYPKLFIIPRGQLCMFTGSFIVSIEFDVIPVAMWVYPIVTPFYNKSL